MIFVCSLSVHLSVLNVVPSTDPSIGPASPSLYKPHHSPTASPTQDLFYTPIGSPDTRPTPMDTSPSPEDSGPLQGEPRSMDGWGALFGRAMKRIQRSACALDEMHTQLRGLLTPGNSTEGPRILESALGWETRLTEVRKDLKGGLRELGDLRRQYEALSTGTNPRRHPTLYPLRPILTPPPRHPLLYPLGPILSPPAPHIVPTVPHSEPPHHGPNSRQNI